MTMDRRQFLGFTIAGATITVLPALPAAAPLPAAPAFEGVPDFLEALGDPPQLYVSLWGRSGDCLARLPVATPAPARDGIIVFGTEPVEVPCDVEMIELVSDDGEGGVTLWEGSAAEIFGRELSLQEGDTINLGLTCE